TMLTLADLVRGVLLPAALAALVLVMAWWQTKRRVSARQSRSWGGPLAVGLAFVGGYLALLGRPPFPPLDATDWLYFLAGSLAVLGTIDATCNLLPQVRVVSLVAIVALAAWLVMRPLLEAPGNDFVPVYMLAVLAGCSWIVAMDYLSSRIPAARWSAVLLAA